jgi:hypothetical protein
MFGRSLEVVVLSGFLKGLRRKRGLHARIDRQESWKQPHHDAGGLVVLCWPPK